MCVCAGGTGAAIVPAAKAIRNKAPQVAARRAQPAVLAAAAAPCVPTVVADGLSPALAGIDGLSPLLTLDPVGASPITSVEARLGSLGEVGDVLAGTGGPLAFRAGGGSAGGGSGGGGSGAGGGTALLPPSASNAPEPASWALMITGFGALGGAMRYNRTARAA